MPGRMFRLMVVLFILSVLVLCHSSTQYKRTRTRSIDRGLLSADCHLSPHPGNCTSKVRRWHFDSEAGQCKLFVWTGCGGNKNRFRSRGQCQRTCKDLSEDVVLAKSNPVVAKCRRLPCKHLRCRHGYSVGVDDRGCQSCQCASVPVPTMPQEVARSSPRYASTCLQVKCRLDCPNGFKQDGNGCETCRCHGDPEILGPTGSTNTGCPEIPCALNCRHGYQIDGTGCQRCVCKEVKESKVCDLTKTVTCDLFCPGGYDRDALGCEICECQPLADENSRDAGTNGLVLCSPFDEFDCAARCEYFVIGRDENGCEFCSCLDDLKNRTPALESLCPELDACSSLDCPDGRELDENGCEICQCRKPEAEIRREHVTDTEFVEIQGVECPATDCPSSCRMVLHSSCPTCECDVHFTETIATESSCFELNCGDLSCPLGHQIDASGCPVCACAEDTGSTSEEVALTLNPTLDNEGRVDPSSISYTTWTGSYIFGEPTTLALVVNSSDHAHTEEDDDDEEYPHGRMCSRRPCGKKCSRGLLRSDQEDCFLCECHRSNFFIADHKRLVDIGVYSARKGVCSLSEYRGPCLAKLTRWHFNSETDACETFEYGGCRGNANNFRSDESCREFCLPEINRDRATRQDRYRKVLGW